MSDKLTEIENALSRTDAPPKQKMDDLIMVVERVPALVAVARAGKRLTKDKNNVHAWEALFQGLEALEAP